MENYGIDMVEYENCASMDAIAVIMAPKLNTLERPDVLVPHAVEALGQHGHDEDLMVGANAVHILDGFGSAGVTVFHGAIVFFLLEQRKSRSYAVP